MAELPPDARRLRAILAYLDEQIAGHETVGIYLRLQREAVRAELTRVESRQVAGPPEPPSELPKSSGPPESSRSSRSARPLQSPRPRQAPAALSPFAPSREMRQSTGFVVQQKRTPNGPEPAVIHTGDCTMIEGTPHRIGDHDARAALTDPNIEPCAFCRPDSELGILD
ncbi:DUF6233 domain-containing protein [Streptomyces sp. HUAS 31]|uniref:DUF6233 domain-containing protein n=1 Tax=Streptomyces TaxID=1883 RepID=UPI002304E7A9|nr:DUF6233 domain-containing protein [Streptomyces sp. HUAS 31]WCD99086.1 DUF6233 domain-containing protein [Streptomyces sp. HUAS 31]